MHWNGTNSESTVHVAFYTLLESCLILTICSIGMIMNLINGLIFFKLTNRVFKYMLALSISEFNYFFLIVLFHSFYLSEVLSSYQLSVFKIIYRYLVVSFAINSIFMEIVIVIERYFILINKNSFQKIPHYAIIIAFSILTFIIYSPNLFASKIVLVGHTGNESCKETFELVSSEFHDSTTGAVIINISWYIRPFLCIFILWTMSVVNSVVFYRRVINSKTRRYSISIYFVFI